MSTKVTHRYLCPFNTFLELVERNSNGDNIYKKEYNNETHFKYFSKLKAFNCDVWLQDQNYGTGNGQLITLDDNYYNHDYYDVDGNITFIFSCKCGDCFFPCVMLLRSTSDPSIFTIDYRFGELSNTNVTPSSNNRTINRAKKSSSSFRFYNDLDGNSINKSIILAKSDKSRITIINNHNVYFFPKKGTYNIYHTLTDNDIGYIGKIGDGTEGIQIATGQDLEEDRKFYNTLFGKEGSRGALIAELTENSFKNCFNPNTGETIFKSGSFIDGGDTIPVYETINSYKYIFKFNINSPDFDLRQTGKCYYLDMIQRSDAQLFNFRRDNNGKMKALLKFEFLNHQVWLQQEGFNDQNTIYCNLNDAKNMCWNDSNGNLQVIFSCKYNNLLENKIDYYAASAVLNNNGSSSTGKSFTVEWRVSSLNINYNGISYPIDRAKEIIENVSIITQSGNIENKSFKRLMFYNSQIGLGNEIMKIDDNGIEFIGYDKVIYFSRDFTTLGIHLDSHFSMNYGFYNNFYLEFANNILSQGKVRIDSIGLVGIVGDGRSELTNYEEYMKWNNDEDDDNYNISSISMNNFNYDKDILYIFYPNEESTPEEYYANCVNLSNGFNIFRCYQVQTVV